ncbi:MAG: type II toxin-antitoxin system RelE/ParE family toxin [Nanoarchaeota archaeon]|nr:type II toxin-antitoxin system RelE/ParE family toxin [Nanoarchaeota archaeon]
MYEVEFSKTAEKQLYKLEKHTQVRIISTLERIKIRPYPHIKKLVDSPYFRLRVGKYRLILDIREGKLIIFIIEIGHRKNNYK